MLKIIIQIHLCLFLCIGLYSLSPAQNAPYRQMFLLRKQRSSNIDFSFGGGCAQLLADGRFFAPIYPGASFQMNVAYSYLWDKLSGFRIGLGMTYAHNGVGFDKFESESIGNIEFFDNESTVVRSTHFTATTDGMHERYDLAFITLPAYFIFQSGHFYSNVGFQIMLPIISAAHFDYGATTIGIGRQIDGTGTTLRRPIEILSVDEQSGRYTASSFEQGGTNLMNIAASIAVGYRYAIDAKSIINFVFYANIGLNKNKIDGDDLVYYANGDYEINNYLHSNSISSLRYMDVGIRISYNMTFGKRISSGNPFRTSNIKYRRRKPSYVL